MLPILRSGRVKGVAHITGGGLYENVHRALPDTLGAEIDAQKWEIPAVFGWLAALGQVNESEMLRTFNCGLGLVLVVGSEDSVQVLSEIPTELEPKIIGHIFSRQKDQPQVVVKHFESAMLSVMRPYVPSLLCMTTLQRKRVAVLISGSGTNLQALIDSTLDTTKKNSAQIKLVISNVDSAAGLKRAERAGIKTMVLFCYTCNTSFTRVFIFQVINHKNFATRLDFDMAIHAALMQNEIGKIVIIKCILMKYKT